MKHLTNEQRHVIQSLLKRGVSLCEIAQELSVDKSTLGREVKRNSSKRGKYQAEKAPPYSSWEKGQIEYSNKLLRQYIPKKEIINTHNTINLKQIQMKINRRPRKNLNFEKPFKLFYNFVNNKVAFAG